MEYPKFKKRVQETIINPAARQAMAPTYGIVLDYNSGTNTCTILTAMPGSDLVGESFTEVPCPMNPGVQGVAPKQGIACGLVFTDGTSTPQITHFYNLHYDVHTNRKQNYANTKLPTYLLDM